MTQEPNPNEISEALLANLKEVSAALDQLAGRCPQTYAAAVKQLETISDDAGDETCGTRFLKMASTYLNYSAWVRSPFDNAVESETSG